MRLHPRARMKKTMPLLERQRKGKVRNPNPNKNLVMQKRRKNFLKSSAFTIMN